MHFVFEFSFKTVLKVLQHISIITWPNVAPTKSWLRALLPLAIKVFYIMLHKMYSTSFFKFFVQGNQIKQEKEYGSVIKEETVRSDSSPYFNRITSIALNRKWRVITKQTGYHQKWRSSDKNIKRMALKCKLIYPWKLISL